MLKECVCGGKGGPGGCEEVPGAASKPQAGLRRPERAASGTTGRQTDQVEPLVFWYLRNTNMEANCDNSIITLTSDRDSEPDLNADCAHRGSRVFGALPGLLDGAGLGLR